MLELINLKNIKERKYPLLIISFFLIIIIIITFKNKKISNIYKTYGMVECNETCTINISLNYEKSNIIKNSKITIEDSKTEIDKYEYGELFLNNNIPMQEIVLYPEQSLDEKIVEIKIEYKKQRIINKIKEIIIER